MILTFQRVYRFVLQNLKWHSIQIQLNVNQFDKIKKKHLKYFKANNNIGSQMLLPKKWGHKKYLLTCLESRNYINLICYLRH